VLTAMLLHQLRKAGVHALAMKPFCSGSRADVEILREMQDGELSGDEINPWFFTEPVAPIASKKKRKITVEKVAGQIRAVGQRCELLLVEGCGGLHVPITRDFLLSDLISELQCHTILVGANRLGVLNHALLSVEALQARGISSVIMVLMEQGAVDESARSNRKILADWLKPIPVVPVDYLGKNASNPGVLKRNSKIVEKLVAQCRGHAYFPAAR